MWSSVAGAASQTLTDHLFGHSQAKYVFFFIGDGMAAPQITAAEVYTASVENPDTRFHKKLTMSQFPVEGMATTYALNSYITDSAAAGTALACGVKTNSGVISMDPDGTVSYTSLASLAKAKGMKVGIVSSVSIDHATPAVFYANELSRSSYYDIAMQMATSAFDYFAGGGVKYPTGKGKDQVSVFDVAAGNGFTIVSDKNAFLALQPQNGQKIIAYNPILDEDKALYYEIDRVRDPANQISLADFTRKGIDLLDNPNGFFMMVEGGKIDWACHANDARTAIDDVLAFDNAIKEAVAFYEAHPTQTLIVITGDHETGGMTIGWAGTKYDTAYQTMAPQTMSYIEFDKLLDAYKQNGQPHTDIDGTMKSLIASTYGIEYASLPDYEKQDLEAAYDRSMGGEAVSGPEKDYLLYGGYEPLTVTLTHILNQNAGLGWTSYSHTGVPVPVFAMGQGATTFDGFYDNTDVAKKLAIIMGVELNNGQM